MTTNSTQTTLDPEDIRDLQTYDIPEEFVPSPLDLSEGEVPDSPLDVHGHGDPSDWANWYRPDDVDPDIDHEELERAIFDILTAIDPKTPKTRALIDLPRWIDEEDVPPLPQVPDTSLTGPGHCPRCGIKDPYHKPLERGRVIERETPGGNPWLHVPDDVDVSESSRFCCPECENPSIYSRVSKEPRYKCQNPRCDTDTFEHPVENPEETGDRREKLFWECYMCEEPIRADFPGVPDRYITASGEWAAPDW